MNKTTATKGFWRMTCQDYYRPCVMQEKQIELINVEKRCPDGGVEYEFRISWYVFPSGVAAKIEIFDDAFIAIQENQALFQILSQLQNPTPDGIHRLLLDLGYVDFSDQQRNPKGETAINTYVCYVQNYLGVMYGENVVSNMRVFFNQNEIDSWLTVQLSEAREAGFVPDDEPATYFGRNDYELSVSKGNEKEGFESYGIACRPFSMNL